MTSWTAEEQTNPTVELLFEDEGESQKPNPSLKYQSRAKAKHSNPHLNVTLEDVKRSNYKSEYSQRVKTLASSGYSLRAFAASIEVPYSTVVGWRRNEPEFAEACEIADMKRHLFYEHTALSNLKNRNFNSQLFSRLAQTIGRTLYEDEAEQVEVSVDPSQMTPDERRRRIRELTEQVRIG